MTALHKEIIKVVLYFEIFEFPVTIDEIWQYCGLAVDKETLAKHIKDLIDNGKLFQNESYYSTTNNRDWIKRREKNRIISEQKLKTARKNAKLIYAFPFVKAVAISGSLSKYAADETADIDYFIIVAKNRLWICRTLLHVFKKITFFAGKQHDFCMNFFLDEVELELKDKNVYTAIESLTIIPLWGPKAIQDFRNSNDHWIQRLFPNCKKASYDIQTRKILLKRLFEAFFYGNIGHVSNLLLHQITTHWWKFKFRRAGYPMEYFDKDLRSTSGESKYHPNDYQRRILSKLDYKISTFEWDKGKAI